MEFTGVESEDSLLATEQTVGSTVDRSKGRSQLGYIVIYKIRHNKK